MSTHSSITNSDVSQEMLAEMQRRHIATNQVELLIKMYEKLQEQVGGYPPVKDLASEDALWFQSVEAALANGWSLDELKKKVIVQNEKQEQASNPYAANLNDDSPFMRDHGNIVKEILERYNRSMTAVPTSGNLEALLDGISIGDEVLIDELSDHILMVTSLTGRAAAAGPKASVEWALGIPLLLNAGLGEKHLRKMAKRLARENPLWGILNDLDRKGLIELILKAHRTTGYPAGITLLPWHKVRSIFVGVCDHSPLLVHRTLLHIMAHTRVRLVDCGKPEIRFAYNGKYAIVEVDPSDANLPMAQMGNRILDVMSSVLDIAIKVLVGKRKEWNQNTKAVLDAVHLHHLIELKDASTAWDIIASPSVKIEQSGTPTAGSILDHGLSLVGVAEVHREDGAVNPNATIIDARVLKYHWLPTSCRHDQQTRWNGSLPDKVIGRRPSGVILDAIHNICDLGNRDGLTALLDAILLTDVLRSMQSLRGPLAGLICKEFPPIFILANGCDPESTTNQGKTNLGRIIAGIWVPGICETVFNRSASAPAQRSMCTILEQYGTALFDEFFLSNDPHHVLGREGLQGLCTGSQVAPGRAVENAKPISLRHPLTFCAKGAFLPSDLMNRPDFLFLDPITQANACTPDELAALMTGKISVTARLAMLRWIEETGFVNRIANLVPSNTWRFNAHAAIAEMLAEKPENVRAYLETARRHAEKLRQGAESGTLAADLGLEQGFSLHALVSRLSVEELESIALHSREAGGLRYETALKAFYHHRLSAPEGLEGMSREYRMPITSITARMGKQLADRPIEVLGYKIERFTKKDRSGNNVPHINVTKS